MHSNTNSSNTKHSNIIIQQQQAKTRRHHASDNDSCERAGMKEMFRPTLRGNSPWQA